MNAKKQSSDLPILQVKVTLNDTTPPVWRRLLVPGMLSLHEFHWDIQRAMGWMNCHLYQFRIDGVDYGVPSEEDEMPMKAPRPCAWRVSRTAKTARSFMNTILGTGGSTGF